MYEYLFSVQLMIDFDRYLFVRMHVEDNIPLAGDVCKVVDLYTQGILHVLYMSCSLQIVPP